MSCDRFLDLFRPKFVRLRFGPLQSQGGKAQGFRASEFADVCCIWRGIWTYELDQMGLSQESYGILVIFSLYQLGIWMSHIESSEQHIPPHGASKCMLSSRPVNSTPDTVENRPWRWRQTSNWNFPMNKLNNIEFRLI